MGARRVNQCLREVLPALLPRMDVLHLCGKGNTDENLRDTAGYCQKEYLGDNYPDALAAADIALSRAGSNTLCELLALNKPMLLVPYPLSASRGDQVQNAESYRQQGLARVLPQERMNADTLSGELLALWQDRNLLLAGMEAHPAKDGTDAVLSLIEDAQRRLKGGFAVT